MRLIGEISKQVRGVTYNKSEAVMEPHPGYKPILRAGNINASRVVKEDFVYVPEKRIKRNQFLKYGDVLIAASSGSLNIVGKAAMLEADFDAGFGAFCKVLRPDVDVVFPRYFKFYFETPSYKSVIKHLAEGANINNLKTEHFNNLQIPLPPLAEQQKIAAILDAADSLRQKDRQLIDHYTTLSQSLFLEMFGDPVTNPNGWEKCPADNYIDLLTGFAFKSNDYSSNENAIHLCGGLIITPTGIDWEKANYWRRDKLEGLERYYIVEGDIVMAMDRPWISSGFKIHKISKSDKESLLVQRTARIRGKNINQDFLFFLYKHSAFERQANTTETTVPHISPKDIRKYELIIPPIALQNEFAKCIEAIEQQKQQAQASLEKSEALFNSLLQRAFKGELTSQRAAA